MPTDAVETLLALAAAHARAVRALEVRGLSFAELRLLVPLRGTQTGRRPTELAHELHLTASGVTRALLPLERRHIVERRRDPDDARASLAMLTPAGSELLDEALEAAGERATRLLRRLSVGQQKQLQRLLEEVGS
ncbi:MAG TPA: MarR family transcriptional regulator [Candidatus Acidoferrum sp.]|jgi:DNA-binding MarR family transcriptional regulator|nr:MarR family transcriptional regulator [Candidatus Acidoferrum sp.]